MLQEDDEIDLEEKSLAAAKSSRGTGKGKRASDRTPAGLRQTSEKGRVEQGEADETRVAKLLRERKALKAKAMEVTLAAVELREHCLITGRALQDSKNIRAAFDTLKTEQKSEAREKKWDNATVSFERKQAYVFVPFIEAR
jgi:hypothetical protein